VTRIVYKRSILVDQYFRRPAELKVADGDADVCSLFTDRTDQHTSPVKSSSHHDDDDDNDDDDDEAVAAVEDASRTISCSWLHGVYTELLMWPRRAVNYISCCS